MPRFFLSQNHLVPSYSYSLCVFSLFQPVDISGQIKKSIFIANYKNEPKFHVSGKLGAKIATEFGIDVSATDSFTISMDVGDVIKREIQWSNLNDALGDINLNLDHEYVQYILSKRRRSLCVIYETVSTHGDSELDSDRNGQGLCHICYVESFINI